MAISHNMPVLVVQAQITKANRNQILSIVLAK